MYKRWYGESKRVPRDINLTRDGLLRWFLEDGSLYITEETTGRKIPCLSLYTNAFSASEVNFLCDILNSRLPNKVGSFTIREDQQHDGKQFHYICSTSKNNVACFFDYISDLPKVLREDYGYKMLDNFPCMQDYEWE